MQLTLAIERGGAELQDRAAVLRRHTHTTLLLADGAGGRGGGAQAADAFVDAMTRADDALTSELECCRALENTDLTMGTNDGIGETTGIVCVLEKQRLFGASVGDSAAWLFTANEAFELTAHQTRKPFLGSGAAFPRGFQRDQVRGVLVVASDGLWKYARLEAIRGEALRPLPDAARFPGLVRLPSGALPDDIAVIVADLR